MHDYGYTREDLANVSIQLRKYANANQDALMNEKKLSLDDYMNARMISDPLCLYDNCLESDGAIAIVITNLDIAKKLNNKPAMIHSFSQGMSKEHQLMTHYHSDNPLESSSYVTAKNIWRLSDYAPKDIDVAQIYDAFSPMIPFSLEAYNFSPQGESLNLIKEGLIDINGDLPVNTSGGSLSEVYLHGMNLITEGVKQIRGSSFNQVKNAKLALITTCDATPNAALILKGE